MEKRFNKKDTIVCLLYSSNKPGFINRDINNIINRVLDGNRLKGGLKK